MFNTLKHRIQKITLLNLGSNSTTSSIVFKNNIKFFSTSSLKENLSNITSTEKSKDFFESNFRIEKAPEHISTFNDLDGSFATEIFNKIDIENICTLPLISGRFSRFWCLTEDSIHHFVMYMAHDLNIGMGLATIALAVCIRLIFLPLNIKSFKNMQYIRLIFPETQEHNEKISKLKRAGETKLVQIETSNFNKFREKYGIRSNPILFLMTLSQGAVLACWAGLVQRFAYNVEDYPEMLTGGFFWFRDLSNIDPYFILPILNSITLTLNLYTNNTQYASVLMLKMRRYLFIIPFFSLPLMCTFETGTILYFCVSSFLNFIINYTLLSERSKKYLGVADFLPGTKLERMNQFRMVNEKYQENSEITKYLSGENDAEKEVKSQEDKKSQTPQQISGKNMQETIGNKRRRK